MTCALSIGLGKADILPEIKIRHPNLFISKAYQDHLYLSERASLPRPQGPLLLPCSGRTSQLPGFYYWKSWFEDDRTTRDFFFVVSRHIGSQTSTLFFWSPSTTSSFSIPSTRAGPKIWR